MTITTKAVEYLLEQYEYYHRQIVAEHGEISDLAEQNLIFQSLIDDPVFAVRDAQEHEVPVKFSNWYEKWLKSIIGTCREQRISMNREAQFRADDEEQQLCRKLAQLIVKVGNGDFERVE